MSRTVGSPSAARQDSSTRRRGLARPSRAQACHAPMPIRRGASTLPAQRRRSSVSSSRTAIRTIGVVRLPEVLRCLRTASFATRRASVAGGFLVSSAKIASLRTTSRPTWAAASMVRRNSVAARSPTISRLEMPTAGGRHLGAGGKYILHELLVLRKLFSKIWWWRPVLSRRSRSGHHRRLCHLEQYDGCSAGRRGVFQRAARGEAV